MYLGIRTDSTVAELYLYDGTKLRAEKAWQADRQLAHGLLSQLEAFLAEQGVTFHDLSGLFVYRGPGSFTGLRIGITVMNTIAYSETVAIVGGEGEGWREAAIERLDKSENDQVVLPLYGAEARITRPKK
jgi:tRNA threonylcarbamoyladenosine biosynthesis protein TsaB